MRTFKRTAYIFMSISLMYLLFVDCSTSPEQRTFTFARHNLRVLLEPSSHNLTAVDTIQIAFESNSNNVYFFLNKSLKVSKIKAGEQEFKFKVSEEYDLKNFMQSDEETRKSYQRAKLYRVDIPPQLMPEFIEIYYSGAIYDSVKSAAFSHTMVADQTTGLIGPEGVFLSGESFWYPSIPQERSTFRLIAQTPIGYRVVTSGQLVMHYQTPDSLLSIWEENHPLDTIYLCAGNYQVSCDSVDDVELDTYFFPASQSLSHMYLASCKKYIRMYNDMIGPYAYKKFAVVENFFPTGYGMPSFTLLGSTVIRLPFITKISLGHEICHNWWGNGVFVDMLKGNWCEGLTVYYADYHYKELESEQAARQYRYEILKDYASYVTKESQDFPLTEFRERTTPATRVIGYGKSMMVFHQMRKMIGDEQFYKALRKLYREKLFQFASWRDFQDVFQQVSQRDFGWFFDQWIDRPGAPVLHLEQPRVEKTATAYRLTAKLAQEQSFYRLYVPIRIMTANGAVDTTALLASETTELKFETASKIQSLKVDPDYDVFRKLEWQEITPSLSQFIGAPQKVIVFPGNASKELAGAYQALANAMNRTKDATIVSDASFNSGDYAASAIMVLGAPTENASCAILKQALPKKVVLAQDHLQAFGQSFNKDGDCTVLIVRNPKNGKEPIVWIWGRSADAINAIVRKLPHYGKYGYLAFRDGRNVLKGNWAVKNALEYHFEE